MEQHERRRHGHPTGGGTSDGSGGSGELENLRRAGARYLAAADEAIRNALSNDSEDFLRNSRQTGGE
jgi:hypothetical protein